MTGLDSLLVACRRDPADDLPRLVLAELLDEYAGSVTCSSMQDPNTYNGCVYGQREYRDIHGRLQNRRCKLCSGSGSVSNGNAERAELIRVQCRIAELPAINAAALGSVAIECKHGRDVCPNCDEPQERKSLRRLEKELLKAHGRGWMQSAFEAGFCYNATDKWLSFRRGLLHVEAPLQTLRERLPRMGRELLWVGSVQVTDREPHDNRLINDSCWWMKRGQSLLDSLFILPDDLFDLLTGGRLESAFNGTFRIYSTTDLAHAALNTAVLRMAWTAAGLPWPTRKTTSTGG